MPEASCDFLDGLRQVCGAGAPETRNGLAIHVYTANLGMERRAMNNADGDMLIGTIPRDTVYLVIGSATGGCNRGSD